MRRLGLLLACLPWCVALAGERASIAAERKALNERYAAEERDCQARFAVTACVEHVRARRRAALAPLRERELQLDDAERQQQAADRRAALAARQQARAERPPPTPAAPPASRPAPAPAGSGAWGKGPRVDPAARAAEAAQRASAAESRRAQWQANQARVARRQAERAAQGKQAQPLPLPGTASAAAR
jgi:colicin import membrane protein